MRELPALLRPTSWSRTTISRVARAVLGVTLVSAGLGQTSNAFAAPTFLTGTVYLDFGADGTMNATGAQTDTGIGNILVKAYDAAGLACGSQTTSPDGTYSVAHSCTGTVRVEATWNEADSRLLGVKPGPHGAGNGGTVQFVSPGASNVNIGLMRPSDYCGTNPQLVASCFLNGTANNDLATAKSLSKFGWAASGDGRGPTNKHAERQATGAVWGVAVQRSTGDTFSSAVLRRHVGLGPGGIAQIYRTTAAGVTTPFLNLGPTFGTYNDAARGLGNAADPSFDDGAFADVGRVGIGDIEINDSGTVLYASNLATREIVSNPVSSTPNLASYGTPPLDCTAQGTARVWGLKTRSFVQGGQNIDRVYAGVSCDSPTVGVATSARCSPGT